MKSPTYQHIQTKLPRCHRRLPNSPPTLLRTLTTVREAWKQFPADRLITATHWGKLDDAAPASFLNRFLKEIGDVRTALATQAPATSALFPSPSTGSPITSATSTRFTTSASPAATSPRPAAPTTAAISPPLPCPTSAPTHAAILAAGAQIAPGRRIARAWGVVYINDDGTVSEESAPAPAPAPQP